MQLRIIDIVQTKELKTRFLAGSQGGERIVRWAHVCELPDPTEWLGEDDLLMTTGLGIPAEADSQQVYIEKMAGAGLAGIMIGENMQAPENLDALASTADRLRFPVLLTQYGVPFSSITRTIIDAERKKEFDRRNAFNRLSVTARMAIEGLSLEQLMARLEKDLGIRLIIMDPQQTASCWHPNGEALPEELKNALTRQPLDFSDNQPAIRRYKLTSGEISATLIPSARGLVLLVRNSPANFLDYTLLQHLAAVISISIEHLYMGVERSLRLGAQLMDDLLNQRLTPYEIDTQAHALQLDLTTAAVAIVRPVEMALVKWGMQLCRMRIPALFRLTGTDVALMAHPRHFPAIQRIIGSEMGVSAPLAAHQRLTEALREARLALLHTGTSPCRFYADIDERLPWLPDNLDEATDTFLRVLGPLEEYDKENSSHLLHTLKVFLEHNRSWTASSSRLHIHKTTLVYRIRKIESLTHRSLDKTEDVAIFWLAFKSGEIAGLLARD